MPQTANVVNFPSGATMEVNGKTIELLPDGRLKNLGDWDKDVASKLAETAGIELGDNHWAELNVMRKYYQEFNVSPVRKL
jgi:tRNA 2-thiouridine synthesizing protein E